MFTACWREGKSVYLCDMKATPVIAKTIAAGATLALTLILAGCKKEELPQEPAEEDTSYYQYGLGKMYIYTKDRQPVHSKDEYKICTVGLDGQEAFPNHLNMSAQIRGRGNSTWSWYPKKPYRIKLDTSTPLMGMAANRDWVLLADFRDVTHLMNNIAFTLSHELGLPCANRSRYVQLTINDTPAGLYMLTEQIEEGGHRVQLDKAEGILLALDMNDGPGENPSGTDNFYSTVFKTACAVKYPKNPDPATVSNVKKAYADLESAIGQRRWDDIQALLDVDSMINYILVQEIIGNGEVDNNPSMRSGYIHRKSNADKWVMGPFWDADAAFGYDASDMYNRKGLCHTFFIWNPLVFGTEPYLHKGAMNGTAPDLFCRLWGIPEFVRALKGRWNQSKDHLLSAALEQTDKTEAVIRASAENDMQQWGISRFDHATEVAKLKKWLKERFTYLDTVINAYPEKTY